MADTRAMAKTSTRAPWKGAITFGLAHIPAGLRPATSGVNFGWFDQAGTAESKSRHAD